MSKIQKMKIVLLTIGKTKQQYLIDGFYKYQKRLEHYNPFEIIEILSVRKKKNLGDLQLKKEEGKMILEKLKPSDHLVLLDHNGKEFNSPGFAKRLQDWMLSGKKRLVFVIGGPYGFSQDVYDRAQEKLSLSRMTFSHQMVRLFFVEQIYRAYTILNNEPYHND